MVIAIIDCAEQGCQEWPDLCCKEHNLRLLWDRLHLHCRASSYLCQAQEHNDDEYVDDDVDGDVDNDDE